MNIQTRAATISAEEEGRRRRVVASANWSAEMEGLGSQTKDYDALSELWITGKISRDELDKRRRAMLKDYLSARGH